MNSETFEIIKTIKKKSKNKRLVFVSGNFNIIHPGHLRLLRFARECGDFLVVGVYKAGSEGAVLQEELRLEGVKAINWVDSAFLMRDQLVSILEKLKPDFVIKGKEHENQKNEESLIVRKYGGKLLFGSGDIVFSSIDLIKEQWNKINSSTIIKPKDFMVRHNFSLNDLFSVVEKFSKLNICVIGDTIVDEYINCDPVGMSQEDPTIVVRPVFKEKYIGAAAIVAAHAEGLGAHVDFYSVVGADAFSEFIKTHLTEQGITAHLYTDESRPTTCKQRYRANGKTLLRVSDFHQHGINREIQLQIFNDLLKVLPGKDLVIFADYNYGVLPQSLVDDIVTHCMGLGIHMVADSQSSSQIGDVSRFKNMLLVTPTEREARLAIGDYNSGLVVLAENLRKISNSKNVLLTLNSEGLLVHALGAATNQYQTDRLPALNNSPKDAAGAGDSLLATASMSLTVGADIWQAAYLGSLAAACQVSRVGNVPLTTKEILEEIT